MNCRSIVKLALRLALARGLGSVLSKVMLSSEKTRRYYVIMLCLFVLLFFVHAKLSGFHGSAFTAAGSVHGHSSDQKMEVNETGKLFPILCLLIVIFSYCRIVSTKRFTLPPVVRVVCSRASFDPDRFLRPPPALIPSRL